MRTLIIIPLLLIFPCILPAQNSLRSNHSFTVNLIGIDYSYEQRLEGGFSLVARAGLDNGQGLAFETENLDGIDQDWSPWDMSPAFSIEPRFYYNTGKRINLGKNTACNSFNFVAIEFRGVLDPVNRDYGAYFPFRFAPMWGMRRVYNNRWLFELNAGVNFYNGNYSNFAIGPRLNARFGIVF